MAAAEAVVIVGAGQAGSDTAAALRSRGFTGPITLIGEEPHLPYQRPPLSKGYAAGTADRSDLELRPAAFYADQGIELRCGVRAVELDRTTRTVVLGDGGTVRYDRLVLATGSRPRVLPLPGLDHAGVHTLRGVDDADALRRLLARPDGARPKRLVIVGAGMIGLELAATARGLGHHVTVVEALRRVLARAVTARMSAWLAEEHTRRGVRLLLGHEVEGLLGGTGPNPGPGVQAVRLHGGEQIPAELVVIGVGVLPNVELAVQAGLAVGDGVLVDAKLRTSDPAIHAIGDCARFPSPYEGRPIRLESVQNASDQARCVAAAITGEPVAYRAVPRFWSGQYDVNLQIAGLTGGADEVVLIGDPARSRFSLCCFRQGRLIGVESVNRPADHGIAGRLLAEGNTPTPEQVRRPGFDLKAHAVQPV
ncbi:NAD(P)/FAD-dependent oxidoreductase [Streptacidiphilus cavernicola]|uniref:NAD(P)/FAD-dependent oxidoreductase n=1 Tax=Streptacidiphilus cavernicola TaxID=3342716 RepID=A0ABV6VR07_9ACTN